MAALAVASCTGDGGPPPSGPGRTQIDDPRMRGSLLVATNFQRGLAIVELPDGDPQPIPTPGPLRVQNAYFLDDGTVLAILEEAFGRVRVYRTSPDGRPVPVGPALDGTFTFSFARDLLLAADCGPRPTAFVLDVGSPSGWRRVDGACGAALSPDATTLVWPRDGRLVEMSVVRAAEPREVVDVTRAQLPPSMAGGVTIGGELRWGEPGVAVAVETGERQAALVVDADGDMDVAPLGESAAGLRSAFAWQPDGELLAISSWSNLEGIVRLFAPGEGRARVVALFSEPLASMVWSPNGDALVVASHSWWTFVTPEGTWLRSGPVPRGDSLPLAWRR